MKGTPIASFQAMLPLCKALGPHFSPFRTIADT